MGQLSLASATVFEPVTSREAERNPPRSMKSIYALPTMVWPQMLTLQETPAHDRHCQTARAHARHAHG